MLAEMLLYGVTRPWLPLKINSRQGRLLRDSVSLWSRARRCRKVWADHEKHCHDIILQGINNLEQRRQVMVLGSGLLRDVPVTALLEAFEQVILVDAVHLAHIWMRYAFNKRVRFIHCDLTGLVEGSINNRHDPLDKLSFDKVDYVISANVLSQLPMGFEEAHQSQIIRWHLDDLKKLGARSRICLLTDISYHVRDAQGREQEWGDLLHGSSLPKPDAMWDWLVAPAFETRDGTSVLHKVHGYKNLFC